MNQKTTFIPIGSGKGGVGKSVFAANLSIALAMMGHSTMAVDLDLGASNLYTYLDIPNKYPGIGDFLKSKNLKFDELAIESSIPNLKFLPGDGRTPFMANISYEQRMVLIKEIKKISARYVILDLGAGTVFNTLNFFELAKKGIIITTLEVPSIINFVMFLRNFLFREISNVAHQRPEIFKMLTSAFQQPIESEALTVASLISKIAKLDADLASQAERLCRSYHPSIVFNMGNHPDEMNVLPTIDNALKRGLSLEADYLGFIFFDEHVRVSAKKREILMMRYPESPASRTIREIAKKISIGWEGPLENSQRFLIEDTRKKYAESTTK